MKVDIFKTHNELPACCVQVTPAEARELIQSLISQLIAHSPNSGRMETVNPDGNSVSYFTISVTELYKRD